MSWGSWLSRLEVALDAEQRHKAQCESKLKKMNDQIKDTERLLASNINSDTREILSQSLNRYREDAQDAQDWLDRINNEIPRIEQKIGEAIRKEGN